MKNYYETLGVPRKALKEDIKKAFRKLAREYHPDVSEHDDAEARFKEINEAYEVLSDDDKRAAYDRLGENFDPNTVGALSLFIVPDVIKFWTMDAQPAEQMFLVVNSGRNIKNRPTAKIDAYWARVVLTESDNFNSIHGRIYIRPNVRPGSYHGVILLDLDGEIVSISIMLEVAPEPKPPPPPPPKAQAAPPKAAPQPPPPPAQPEPQPAVHSATAANATSAKVSNRDGFDALWSFVQFQLAGLALVALAHLAASLVSFTIPLSLEEQYIAISFIMILVWIQKQGKDLWNFIQFQMVGAILVVLSHLSGMSMPLSKEEHYAVGGIVMFLFWLGNQSGKKPSKAS